MIIHDFEMLMLNYTFFANSDKFMYCDLGLRQILPILGQPFEGEKHPGKKEETIILLLVGIAHFLLGPKTLTTPYALIVTFYWIEMQYR